MSFLNTFKEQAGRYLLKRSIGKEQKARIASGYEQAKEIGILYDATERSHLDAVHYYANKLREDHKKVFELGFVNQPELSYDTNFNVRSEFFTKKQLAWNFLPDKSAIARFLNQEFDLLLNIYLDDCLSLQAVSAYSKAHFRVGRYSVENVHYCDMMVDVGGNTELNYLIKQMDRYIKTI